MRMAERGELKPQPNTEYFFIYLSSNCLHCDSMKPVNMIFYNYSRLTHSRGDLCCKPSDHRSLARHYMDYSHPNIERWRRPSQPQVWTPTQQIHSLYFFTSYKFGQLSTKKRLITARYEREQCPLQGPLFCMWGIWSHNRKRMTLSEWPYLVTCIGMTTSLRLITWPTLSGVLRTCLQVPATCSSSGQATDRTTAFTTRYKHRRALEIIRCDRQR